METFSLEQVTYPTGGKTILTYQANDYDYTNSAGEGTPTFKYVQLVKMDSEIVMTNNGTISGTIDLTNIYPQIPTGNPQTNATVNVAFRYQSNFSPLPYSNSPEISFTLGGDTWVIDGATCGTDGVCTATLPVALNNTVYHWSATIGPGIDMVNTFAGIYATISYQETQQVSNQLQNNYISLASGLRIQSITNYKDANTIASEKLYSYNYLQDKLNTGTPQEYSYGRLMSFPTYARYDITSTSGGGYCTALVLFGSSLTSLTSASQGNIVGYDQVTETTVDPTTGLDIGKTVYQYFNSSDTAINYNGYSIPGVLNIGNNLNGSLLSKTDYTDNNGTYTKVDEMDNYYHTTNRKVYYSPKYQSFQGLTNNANICSPGVPVEKQVNAWFYPSIKSEKVLMDSTKSIFYQQGDPTKTVVTSTSNFYDNPAHYQITRSRTIDSKGNTIATHIKYPQDYLLTGNTHTGNTFIDTMLGRNMVAETIEKQDSLYYSGPSTGYVTGAQLSLYRILSTNSNTVVPDKIYKFDVQSPVTNFQPFSFSNNTLSMDSRYRQMVSFDQYDPNNNIQQYTSTDQDPVTIIWDYTNTYPISQVKNAALADVAATSFEADGKGGWTFSGAPSTAGGAITGSLSYSLSSGSISKTGLTSTTKYIVSGWTKGTVTLTGGTQSNVITGKTINGWTYLEVTVTGTTSVTISGGAGVYIDELRLYPSTA